MKTAEKIQGEICEIQESDLLFEDQIVTINKLLKDWKVEAWNEAIKAACEAEMDKKSILKLLK